MTDKITIDRETAEQAANALLDLPLRTDREVIAEALRAALAAQPAPVAVPLTAERVMELARKHGCVYTNRHYPTSPAVSFSHDKLQAFVQAVLAAGNKS